MNTKFKIIIYNVLTIMFTYNTSYSQFYGQFGQDKYVVENIFKDKKNGVFFDIGAHNGITCSNTYHMEKYLGWTGVCVEPQDDKFEALKKNRTAICVNGCIFNTTGEVDFLKIRGPIEGYSGIIETYNPQHSQAIESLMEQFGGSKETVKVKTYNFNDICKTNNIKHIDFLSIDTEGCEEQIIKSIDFSNINIEVITVENNYDNKNIRTYLESKGFKYVCRLGVDEIYKK